MTDPNDTLTLKPLGDDAPCQVHELPTCELPFALVNRMREPGGVNACRACVDRAADEANRLRGLS